MEEIREKFALIEDWRHSGYVIYNLADVLVIVFCAVLCGLTEIHTYAENHEEYFKEVLGMEKMISRAELGRILAALDGDTVGKVMVDLMRERLGTAGEVAAVDGKAIRSTSKSGTAHSALQIITAYITATGVVLG